MGWKPKKGEHYLLRWRFDYLNRPARYGQWSRPHQSSNWRDMASFQPTDGLIRASVEGKDIVTREIKTLADCDGSDYCLFQWMAQFRTSALGLPGAGYHQFVGLKLVTRDHWLMVFQDGKVRKQKRDKKDKEFHYQGYGR